MTTSNVIASTQTRNCALTADMNVVDVYGEWTVRNDCGRTVFVLRQNGCVQTVTSTKFTGYNRGVEITEMVRSTADVNVRGYVRLLNDTTNRESTTYTVTSSALEKGPVYIPQLGIAVGYYNDEKLREAHPFVVSDSLQNIMANRIRKINEGLTSIVCSINSYDITVNEVYCIINGGIYLCNVTHDASIPEKIVLSLSVGTMGDQVKSYTLTTAAESNRLDRDSLKDYSFETSDGELWFFSLDKSVLVNKIKEQRQRRANLFDSAEVELKIKQRVEDVEASKLELEKQVELLQKKIKNLEEELGQRATEAKKTHDEKMCEMKLGIAQQEQSLAEQKFENEKLLLSMKSKDNQRKLEAVDRQATYDKLEFEQKMMTEQMQQETDRIKAASDLEIAKAKVETAQIAKATAATAETSGMVKSAAVIIPAAISIGAAAYALKASAAASVAAVTVSNPIVASVALAAAAAIALVKTNTGKTILNKTCSAVKSTASAIWSGTKKVASTATSCISGIYNKAKSVASSVFDCGRNAVESVCSGAKSLFSKTCDTISSWFW